jgi:hypothetical protein
MPSRWRSEQRGQHLDAVVAVPLAALMPQPLHARSVTRRSGSQSPRRKASKLDRTSSALPVAPSAVSGREAVEPPLGRCISGRTAKLRHARAPRGKRVAETGGNVRRSLAFDVERRARRPAITCVRRADTATSSSSRPPRWARAPRAPASRPPPPAEPRQARRRPRHPAAAAGRRRSPPSPPRAADPVPAGGAAGTPLERAQPLPAVKRRVRRRQRLGLDHRGATCVVHRRVAERLQHRALASAGRPVSTSASSGVGHPRFMAAW